jgi:endoglucanase
VRRQVQQAALVLVVIAACVIAMLSAFRSTPSVRLRATPAPTATLAPAPTPTPDIALALSGTQIVLGGQPVTLVGVARYSLEYACHGDGHFQLADFQAMRSWGMNTVRFPLSSAFWRNLDGKCPDYQATVAEAVANAEQAGLYVILDIQRDAPFSLPQDALDGGSQCPLPDQYDAALWRQAAQTYRDDPRVLFDLFGEPYDVSAAQWAHGGSVTTTCYPVYAHAMTYQAIGMPDLAAQVRAIAPHNLIILSGLGWGYDLSELTPVNLPGILYGTHPWNHGDYQAPWDWPRAFGDMAQHLPVIATEFGAYDCQTGYIATEIAYFEKLHMSFLAWAWSPGECSGPGLIADWNGTPTTPYGQYIRQQMLQVAARTARDSRQVT